MRVWIIIGICLVLSCSASTSGHAEKWCSFEQNKKSQLNCGYSTFNICRQAAGACLLDADFR
jgi:hypothetical protein